MSLRTAEDKAKGHGVYMAQEVIQLLEAAGHVCCVTGIRALRYYGASRVSNVDGPLSRRLALPADVSLGMGDMRGR